MTEFIILNDKNLATILSSYFDSLSIFIINIYKIVINCFKLICK